MSADNLTPAVVDFLLSAAAHDALAELAAADLHEAETMALLTRLRKRYAPEEAAALLTQARLRKRAAAKFPHADSLFFTAESLEQATAAPVAAHHAAWIDQYAPPGPVLDLGCGIGGDLLALAQRRTVIAYELDPLRLRLAQANVDALDLHERVELRQGDWTEALRNGTLSGAAAAFVDPARRVNGRRIFRLDKMLPPIADIKALQAQIPAIGAKVMPGVDDAEVPDGCGVEFVSHDGVCKEALLWFGPLAAHRRWASVYVNDEWQTLIAEGAPPPLGPVEASMVLHEPDPALIRAGAFAELCAAIDGYLFDPQIAYILSPTVESHPLTRSFRLREVHPFGLKLLNRRLTALDIGAVELKKRGFPQEPEAFRPRLKLTDGGDDAVIFFTRRGDTRLMLIGRRIV